MSEIQLALQINDAALVGRKVPNTEKDLKGNIGLPSYNPLKTPADLKLAQKHGIAKRVYVNKQHDNHDDDHEEEGPEVCVCCGIPVEGEPIPLSAELDQLYHLGSGFALYFRFIKYTIGMLVLTMLISGIYNLVTNSISDGCAPKNLPTEIIEEVYCVQGYILSYAIPNKRGESHYLIAQAAVNLGVVVAIMFFFHYIRYRFRKTEVEADDKTITPSDYTIVIEGLPPATTNKQIVDWIKTFQTEDKPLIVEKIIRPFDINEYIKLTSQRNAILKDEEEHEKPKAHEMSASEKKKKDAQYKEIEDKLAALKQEGALQKCPVAYVTFRTAAQASFVSSKFKKPLLQKVFGVFMSKLVSTYDQINGVRVEVERAPEPTDIQWLNLRYGERERQVHRFITNSVTLILVILSFGGILLVNWGQNKAIDKYGKGSPTVQGLSIVASVVIVVMNTALTITIDILTKFEKHLTTTKFLKGVAQKLAIAQFFNTALTSFFAEMILADHGVNENRLEEMNFYGKGGLLEGIFWVFVTQAITGPALTIIDFGYFAKLFKRKQVLKQGEKNTLIQKDAHTLFEGPTLNMPAKYAAMIKAILLTTFYAPALPIAMVFTIAGFCLSYWADKYVLLKRNALPSSLGDDLADAMIEILEWSAFTWAAGNLIYIYSLHSFDDNLYDNGNFAFTQDARILGWIALGLSLFHIFFPMEELNEKLFPIKDEVTENETYTHVNHEFITDYDCEDPNLRLKALYKKTISRGQTTGDKFYEVVKAGAAAQIHNSTSPNEQPEIKEPEVDFKSLDLFANRLDHEHENQQQASPAKEVKSQRSLVALVKEKSKASPRGESPRPVDQDAQAVQPFDAKSEEQRLIRPQQVHSKPESPANQNQEIHENHIELQIQGEVPKLADHFDESKTPSQHIEQNHALDESYNVKSEECVETPDASRRHFYVNRTLFSP